MRAKQLKEMLEEIIEQKGDDVDFFFETPKGTIFTADDDAVWYEMDDDEVEGADNAVCLEIKSVA